MSWKCLRLPSFLLRIFEKDAPHIGYVDEEILLGAPYSHVRKQQTCHHRTALLLLLSGDVNLQTLVTIYTNANTQDDYTICIVWETWAGKCESESNCNLFHKYPSTQCMLYFLACTIEIRPFLGNHTIHWVSGIGMTGWQSKPLLPAVAPVPHKMEQLEHKPRHGGASSRIEASWVC